MWGLLDVLESLLSVQSAFCVLLGVAVHALWLRCRRAPPSARASSERLRSDSYPEAFPKGWYPLLFSNELDRGDVKHVEALGCHFAVFRGHDSGQVGVVDAFCPHLGANMSIGGQVRGDCLECPFHKWQFDRDGKCTRIPYTQKKIPRNADTTAYPCQEYHGLVCVFFDKDGGAPCYELPVQADIADGRLVYRGNAEGGEVRMNLQEFAENAADWMHFDPLHSRMMVPFTRWEVPLLGRWLKIHHEPGTVLGGSPQAAEYGPKDPHFLYFLDHAQLMWRGELVDGTDAQATITFCGPGPINIFRFKMPKLGYIVMFHTHLPLGEIKQRVRFHWFADPSIPRMLVWYVVGLWYSQWTNDIDIWENKVHHRKPCLVNGDGPIAKVRAWYKQFYSAAARQTRPAYAPPDGDKQRATRGTAAASAGEAANEGCAGAVLSDASLLDW